MNSIDLFLEDLRGQGVTVWVDATVPDRLKLRAPEGVLTTALCDTIWQRKSELLALLGPSAVPPIAALPVQPSYELSAAQRRLWVLMQMDPGSAAYNVPLHFELRGSLRRDALEHAFAALVARHESLRTNITVRDGEPRQMVRPHLDLRIGFEDLSADPDPEATARILGSPHSVSDTVGLAIMWNAALSPVEAAAAIAVEEFAATLTFDEAESLGLDGTGRDR